MAEISVSHYLTKICKRLSVGYTPEQGKPIKRNPYINFKLFAKSLLSDGKKERTVKAYLFNIHRFQAEVNPENLSKFESFVEGRKKASPNAIQRTNYFVRNALIHYLKTIGHDDWEKSLTHYKNVEAECHDKTFPEADLNKLLLLADADLRLYMKLAYFGGMRNQEILLLDIKWINETDETIGIPSDVSKSRKKGIVHLPSDIFNEMLDYAKRKYPTKKEKDPQYVLEFIKRTAEKKFLDSLEKEEIYISKKIKELAKESKITTLDEKGENISPHAFRHCFAKFIDEKGFSMPEKQRLMRASSSVIVDRYSHTGDAEISKKWKEKVG
jgi:integrase